MSISFDDLLERTQAMMRVDVIFSDEAVSPLDIACARVAISPHAIPAEMEDSGRRIEALETERAICERERSVGVDTAMEMIAKRVQTSRAGLENSNRPIGVFLLCGPSGVGKTETALAEALYGGEDHAVTINMSEYQEAHTVSTLKGSLAGYVRYGEGGVLTEAVRRRPYSVVFVDEVEKAHPDIHEIFFQIFDKGWMDDAEGRRIDFRNTLILLTSNVGSDLIMNLCRDPDLAPEPEGLAQALRQPLLKVFPAALLGRLVTIPYCPLSDAMIGMIARLQLDHIGKRIANRHGVPFTYDDAVVTLITERCTEVESGGRMIDAILTNTLLPALSEKFLTLTPTKRVIKTLPSSRKEASFVANLKRYCHSLAILTRIARHRSQHDVTVACYAGVIASKWRNYMSGRVTPGRNVRPTETFRQKLVERFNQDLGTFCLNHMLNRNLSVYEVLCYIYMMRCEGILTPHDFMELKGAKYQDTTGEEALKREAAHCIPRQLWVNKKRIDEHAPRPRARQALREIFGRTTVAPRPLNAADIVCERNGLQRSFELACIELLKPHILPAHKEDVLVRLPHSDFDETIALWPIDQKTVNAVFYNIWIKESSLSYLQSRQAIQSGDRKELKVTDDIEAIDFVLYRYNELHNAYRVTRRYRNLELEYIT